MEDPVPELEGNHRSIDPVLRRRLGLVEDVITIDGEGRAVIEPGWTVERHQVWLETVRKHAKDSRTG